MNKNTIFALGMLAGMVLLIFLLLATNNWERPYKTIARLEAERDSLKNITELVRQGWRPSSGGTIWTKASVVEGSPDTFKTKEPEVAE